MAGDNYAAELVLWKFLETQWPIVVEETARQFTFEARNLLTNAAVMERAVRKAAPIMFPLTYEEPLDKAVTELRDVAATRGWRRLP